jgi:hypothetical protein
MADLRFITTGAMNHLVLFVLLQTVFIVDAKLVLPGSQANASQTGSRRFVVLLVTFKTVDKSPQRSTFCNVSAR